jgi:uncharacterized protein with HEPN domain
MQREILLLGEMIDVVEQILRLTSDMTEDDVNADRVRRDALFCNFTVLGEAAANCRRSSALSILTSRGTSRHGSGTA